MHTKRQPEMATEPDGFRVPCCFAEFYEQSPDFCRYLAMQFLYKRYPDDTVEELEQEFLAHLMERQIIEKFDANKVGGVPHEKLFFSYVKTMLLRRYLTLKKKKEIGALHYADLSIHGGLPESGMTTEEVIHAKQAKPKYEAHLDEQVFMQEFREYVAKKDERLPAVMDSLVAYRTQDEAAEALGFSHDQMRRLVVKLKRYGKQFKKGNRNGR